MSKYFSKTQQIIEQTASINHLMRKAEIQHQALVAVRKSLNLEKFATIHAQQIRSVYCNAKVVKIYCDNAYASSKLTFFTADLLQYLKQAYPILFPRSIQKIKLLILTPTK